MEENNWNTLEITPPDKVVEVMDNYGNMGFAEPTILPFKVEKNNIVHCEPYWDGWLIHGQGLESPIKGRIIKWREI